MPKGTTCDENFWVIIEFQFLEFSYRNGIGVVLFLEENVPNVLFNAAMNFPSLNSDGNQ